MTAPGMETRMVENPLGLLASATNPMTPVWLPVGRFIQARLEAFSQTPVSSCLRLAASTPSSATVGMPSTKINCLFHHVACANSKACTRQDTQV